MPGPPKKPTALSNIGPRKHRKKKDDNEPQPEQKKTKPPSWLSGKAKHAYRELAEILDEINVITVADRKALELLCDSYSEYRDARAFVIKNGHTYTTENGQVCRYPQVKIAEAAWKRCYDMLRQFGLTPSSRAGVETVEKKDATNPLTELIEKNKDIRRIK